MVNIAEAHRSSFLTIGGCPLQVRNAFQEMARQQAGQGLHPQAPQQPQLSPPPLQQRAPEIPAQLLDPLTQVRVLSAGCRACILTQVELLNISESLTAKFIPKFPTKSPYLKILKQLLDAFKQVRAGPLRLSRAVLQRLHHILR